MLHVLSSLDQWSVYRQQVFQVSFEKFSEAWVIPKAIPLVSAYRVYGRYSVRLIQLEGNLLSD